MLGLVIVTFAAVGFLATCGWLFRAKRREVASVRKTAADIMHPVRKQ